MRCQYGSSLESIFTSERSPEFEGYQFFEFYEAAYQIGGDYYDYIQLPNERLAILVADVVGKGMPAALLMAKIAGEAKYLLSSEVDPVKAVERINVNLYGNGAMNRFVTMVVTVVDRQRNAVTVVNAGHPHGIARRGR